MRARNIKPGFFKNEELASCSLYARLLFIGLWCMADRDGRMEKRPLRIKAEVFPYDSLDINGELTVLERSGFVQTYVVNGKEYLQVVNFLEHQRPHHTEAKSKLPTIPVGSVLTVSSPLSHGEYPPDSLIPDSLIQEEKPIPASRSKKDDGPRGKLIAVSQNVQLTQAETDRLISERGKNFYLKCVDVLNNYKGSSGKKYKDDNLAIRSWVIDKVLKEHGDMKENERLVY